MEVNGSLAAGLRLAGNLRTSGNAAMAISLYQSLAEKHPGDAEPLVGLAESFQDSGQYVEARQAALQATALAANDARGYTLAGRASLGLRKPGQALTFFAQALARDPRDPAAWNGKGVAHEIRGEHAKAQQAFLAALEQAPDDIEIRSNQAFSLALSGDYERGIYLLGEIASLPIAPPRVRQNLALALAMKGDSSSSLRIARMDIGNRQAKGNLAFIEHVEKLAEVSTATAAPVQPVVMIEPLF